MCICTPALKSRPMLVANAVFMLPLGYCFPQSLSALLKAMAGEVPWARYAGLLAVSHCHGGKDHATAISTAQLVQCLVSGVRGKRAVAL